MPTSRTRFNQSRSWEVEVPIELRCYGLILQIEVSGGYEDPYCELTGVWSDRQNAFVPVSSLFDGTLEKYNLWPDISEKACELGSQKAEDDWNDYGDAVYHAWKERNL